MERYSAVESGASLSVVFNSDLELVAGVVADALAFVLRKTSRFEQFTFKLALFESLVNAVKHGGRSNPERKVKLSLAVKPDRIEIVIDDGGKGFDWRKQMRREESPADVAKPSGRGLFLLRSYNCHPDYNEKGNVLSLRIDLK